MLVRVVSHEGDVIKVVQGTCERKAYAHILAHAIDAGYEKVQPFKMGQTEYTALGLVNDDPALTVIYKSEEFVASKG